MAQHVLDLAAFRAGFPAYSNAGAYPDATIEMYWTDATVYLGDYDGCLLNGPALQSALNKMTAHLMYSAGLIAAGTMAVIVKESKVDKVSVSLEPPPAKGVWDWWLLTTPYGAQLLALLKARSAGGFYVTAGYPERGQIRKAGGRY